jgi:hypothetical protein
MAPPQPILASLVDHIVGLPAWLVLMLVFPVPALEDHQLRHEQ